MLAAFGLHLQSIRKVEHELPLGRVTSFPLEVLIGSGHVYSNISIAADTSLSRRH